MEVLILVYYLMHWINHVKELIILFNNVKDYYVLMHQIIMIQMKNVINLNLDVKLQDMDVLILINVKCYLLNHYVN